MRNTYGTQATDPSDVPAPFAALIRGAMTAYWSAVALGDDDRAARAKSRMEKYQLMATQRRSTQRMLAVVAEILPPEPVAK